MKSWGAPFAIAFFLPVMATAQEAPGGDVATAYERDVRPLLAKRCFSCHGGAKARADLNLEGLKGKELTAPKLWKKVWERVRTLQMPPAGQPQPTPAERRRLLDWIEGVFANATIDGKRDPGPLPPRRLNVREHMNTLRDLMVNNARPSTRKASSFEPLKDGRISLYRMIPPPEHPTDFVARMLPQDTNAGGFDTIADNLSLPPFLMEKYLRVTKVMLDDVYSTKGREKSGRYNWPLRAELGRLEEDPPPKGLTPRQALVKFLQGFATRAFRRPVGAEEVEKYAQLFELAQKKGESFETSIRLPLQAILVSPKFVLLWGEKEEKGEGPVRRLNDYELATRLSYFLWSSMPDQELTQLAQKGLLHEDAVLEKQVRRMLADWRVRDGLLPGFLLQWLQVDRLDRANPDAEKYASYFQDNLGELMTLEITLFADAILVEDRSIIEFVDADWGFLCYPLAQHYGDADFPGKKQPPNTIPNWYRVKFADKRRGGVLTMGKMLTGTSQPLRTSPVARGKWVLETLLGAPPPPPPPDVDNVLRDDKTDIKTLTVRQRMEKHRAEPSCAACHRLIDPLGMALETFDPVGRWRDKDQDQPIDPSGELIDGTKFNGIRELKAALVSRKEEFARAFAQHMLAYALGRKLDYYDVKTVREITTRVIDDDYRFSRVVVEVAKSYAFRYRRVKDME
ncbi:MAG: DUF1592 domain-containing protein [Gemmataceae bacterium]